MLLAADADAAFGERFEMRGLGARRHRDLRACIDANADRTEACDEADHRLALTLDQAGEDEAGAQQVRSARAWLCRCAPEQAQRSRPRLRPQA
jgi:hypothetical protein